MKRFGESLKNHDIVSLGFSPLSSNPNDLNAILNQAGCDVTVREQCLSVWEFKVIVVPLRLKQSTNSNGGASGFVSSSYEFPILNLRAKRRSHKDSLSNDDGSPISPGQLVVLAPSRHLGSPVFAGELIKASGIVISRQADILFQLSLTQLPEDTVGARGELFVIEPQKLNINRISLLTEIILDQTRLSTAEARLQSLFNHLGSKAKATNQSEIRSTTEGGTARFEIPFPSCELIESLVFILLIQYPSDVAHNC